MKHRRLIIPHTAELLKVYDTQKVNQLNQNHQLLDILPLNIDQLTSYLETAILDNPFIEMNYPIEQQTNKVLQDVQDGAITGVDPQLPEMPLTLPAFLIEQIMLYRPTTIRDLMVKLVDKLDERGYLPYTYQTLATQWQVDELMVLDAITLLQQLEPAGIGAYDLQNCLMLQTEQDEQAPASAYYLLENGFDLISQGAYEELMTQFNLSADKLTICLNYYKSLRPYPATIFDHLQDENLLAELVVKDNAGQLECDYRLDFTPSLVFNHAYYDEMLATQDEEVMTFIAPMKQHFEGLQTSLMLRQELIEQVTQALVFTQAAFFRHQTEQLSPLLMKQIANLTGLSDALVHLALSNKALEFDKQVRPLTDYIVAGARKGKDIEAPKVDILQVIEELLRENIGLVSDAAIKLQLSQRQIYVTEQQVAAYRDQLGSR